MKRTMGDREFIKTMTEIEKKVAKIFNKNFEKVTASWDGNNKITIEIFD